MNDRELLEMAAKAAGLRIEGDADALVVFPGHYSGGFSVLNDKGGSSLWNPLTDDGDALRLAVKLNIQGAGSAVWATSMTSISEYETDHYAATRRAVVRAAAAIGANKGA